MSSTYMWIFGVAGALMAILLIRALLPMLRREEWTAATVLGASTVVLPNATTAAAVFLGDRSVILDGFYNGVVTYGGTAARVNMIASPILALIAVLCLAASLRLKAHPNLASAALSGLVILGLIFGSFFGSSIANGGVITLLLVLIAAIFMPRGRGFLEGAALGLAFLVVLSLVGALVATDSVAATCGLRKCGVLGFLFSGIGDNNNAFGLLAAMAVPVLYFGLRKHQLLFATAAAALALSSGSRTAAIAAAVGLAFCAAHKGQRVRTTALHVSVAAVAALGAGVVLLPLLPLSPSAFTGRVALWRTAFEEMAKQPLLGHGGEFWREQVNFRVIAHAAGYSTHNQFVESYFVAGVAGTVLLVLALVVTFRSNRGHLGEISILLIPMMVCALTERPWSLGPVDWLSWSLLVVLTTRFTTVRTDHHVDELEDMEAVEHLLRGSRQRRRSPVSVRH